MRFVIIASMYGLLVAGLCAAILISGCAFTGDHTETLSPGAPPLTFVQVKAAPESYNGQPVTFGGKVLGARRLKEGTRIEILQLPLTDSLQPTSDLSTSQGRFVALRKEFLDPATIPAGTFITVTGEMAGSITLPLDETEYTYPLMHATSLRVWSEQDEEAPRIRRPLGPGPYWGPYWSPYWHPWPYYW
ncbi:Slp family lipoprotein [Nitrospira sp. BLG_1]|uniref:Slp family lipoprotein n=1 Tax=Nitrospira sp. BLG_1 TaxID=3395883 RepID=UPI0039BD0628